MSQTFSIEQLTATKSAVETPMVLLAATDRWVPTARLAMALTKVGCVVDAVCPSGHPIGKTSATCQTYPYSGLLPLMSFARAIRTSDPDLVIPCDDLATSHLQQLYEREIGRGESGSQVCRLIERSIGAAESFKVVSARSAFMQLAKQEGIRVPRTAVITNQGDLLNWIGQIGFPTVLKADGTSGGDGVKVVRTLDEAKRAFRKLKAPPLMARAIKRAAIDRDSRLVWPSIFRRRPIVNAQAFVGGHEATSTIACWKGSVIAGLHFEVIQKTGSTGHATVVRRTDDPEMVDAGEKIARRLKLSGIYGLDFMLEADTNHAYLIEVNPRSTQVGHLSLGAGHDLPAALYAALSREAVQPSPKVTENDTVTLFPQEWIRDPQSPFLRSAYHDVPWEETELIRDCVSNRRKQSRWYPRAAKKDATSVARSSQPVAARSESTAAGLD